MNDTETTLRRQLERLAGHARTTPTRPLGSNELRRAPTGADPLPTLRPGRSRVAALLVAAAAVVAITATTIALRGPSPERQAVDRPITVDGTVAVDGATDGDDGPEAVDGGEDGRLAELLEPGAVRAMATAPIAGRSGAAAVWTGDELLIWGGYVYDGRERPLDDGAAYDPITDSWRTLPPAPIAGRAYPAAVWTGKELVIWGGSDAGRLLGDGAAYNPASDTWRLLPDAPIGPAMKSGVVWTGTDLVIAGGLNGNPDTAIYNPAGNSWSIAQRAPGDQTPPYPRAVWAGDRAIFLLLPFLSGPMGTVQLASYQPATDSWTSGPAPITGIPHLVWTGTELLAISAAEAAAYNPDTGQWRTLAIAATGNLLDMVWTGRNAVFYDWANTITTYSPASGAWITTDVSLPAAARSEPAVVWADGLLLVWGGPPLNPDAAGQRPDPGGFVARPLDDKTASPTDIAPTTGQAPTTGTLPATTAPPGPNSVDGRIPVAIDDQGGTGYMQAGMPPATINGRPVPLTNVYDANGNHIGYMACRYFPRSVVEDPSTDPFALCGNPTATTVTG